MRISLGYPDRAAERTLLAGDDRRDMVDALPPLLSQTELHQLQQQVQRVHAAEPLLNYVQDLIAATRSGRWFLQGLSPRAGIAVVRAAKAQALLSGRDYVAPDDVQAILPQTMAHRLVPVGDAGRGAGRAGARHARGGAAGVSTTTVRPEPPVLSSAEGAEGRPLRQASTGSARTVGFNPVSWVRRRFRQLVAGQAAAHRHHHAHAAQRLHPAHPARLHAGRHRAGAAGGVHQLPAQPGLPADLPAGRQRGGGHARVPWHAARSVAAPDAA